MTAELKLTEMEIRNIIVSYFHGKGLVVKNVHLHYSPAYDQRETSQMSATVEVDSVKLQEFLKK